MTIFVSAGRAGEAETAIGVASLIGAAAAAVRVGYGRSARRRHARRDALLLQRFSDRELGDIGLTRFDLVWRG